MLSLATPWSIVVMWVRFLLAFCLKPCYLTVSRRAISGPNATIDAGESIAQSSSEDTCGSPLDLNTSFLGAGQAQFSERAVSSP
jgi:hypothetical protein